MSQPVAIIASIKMQEASFKKMLKTEKIKEFAAIIEETIFNNSSNYYIFRYIKKEGLVFSYFFFNHGNSTTLDEAMDWLPIKELALYSDSEDAGYVFSTLDAANFNKEDIHTAYEVKNNKCEAISELPDEILKQFYKDIKKYFLKEIDKDFANNFYKSRIVDKSIVKECKKLMEKRRIDNVLANLKKASFTKPLHIFGNYFYNGTTVYYQFGKCTILEEIDPNTFVQTPYGAADVSHVIIDGKVLNTSPVSFKKLQKGETCYYLNKEKVFNSQLELIEEADAVSFKMIDEYHCVDDYAIYFVGQRITKESLGKYKIHPEGYFYYDKILIGERTVYFGHNKLDVYAESFKVLECIERNHLGVHGCIFYVAEDKFGKMLLYNETGKKGWFSHYNLLRIDNPKEVLLEIQAKDKLNRDYRMKYYPPSIDYKDSQKYYEEFKAWQNKYFDEFYKENKFRVDLGFYEKINNYFYVCFHMGKYDEILSLYEKIIETAWLNPHLFHHTACTYSALGKYEKSVKEVRKAVIYGYEQCKKIFIDTDLEPLFEMESFKKLKKYYNDGQSKAASIELLRAIVTLPADEYGIRNFVSNLIYKFYFYDVTKLKELSQVDENYMKEYKKLLQQFYDNYFRLYVEQYKDYESVHPEIHYEMIKQLFRDAHVYGGYINTEKLKQIPNIIKILKDSLNNSNYKERNLAMISELKSDSFFTLLILNWNKGCEIYG